jgi:hypothetical protein
MTPARQQRASRTTTQAHVPGKEVRAEGNG